MEEGTERGGRSTDRAVLEPQKAGSPSLRRVFQGEVASYLPLKKEL
jgi:hypothetical protein